MMVHPLSFRLAGPDDAALIARMNQQLIMDEGSKNPMSLAELEARMRHFLLSDWSCAILELDSATVGYALYQARRHPYTADRQEIYLRQYLILRDYRGTGIGRAGIELLETEVFSPDAAVVIDVLSTNSGGARFWESVGFEPYAVTMRKK